MIICDNHRHYGGCITPEMVCGLLKNELNINDIEKMMICREDDPKNFLNFLKKFDILNEIKWDKDAIIKTTQQIHWHLIGERIDYSELHFSVNKYMQYGWDPIDVIALIHDELNELCNIWGNKVGLVLSLKYESPKDEQILMSNLIENKNARDAVIGIDLVGDESFFDANFYAPIFEKWKFYGKGLQAHVGESQGVENVKRAIIDMNVDRIAHGIKIIDDIDVINLAKECDICFDIALSSNIFTGVVGDIKNHPVKKMLDYGLNIAIGTDDPVQYSTTIEKEINLLVDNFGITSDKVHEIMMNSVKYSFDENIRKEYVPR